MNASPAPYSSHATVAAVAATVAVADDEADRTRRLAFAATHSWAGRAAAYLSILERLKQNRVS